MQSHVSKTLFKRGITRRSLLCSIPFALPYRATSAFGLQPTREQTALVSSLKGTNAIAVVLHQKSGGILATYGNTETTATPGSLLKPLLLYAALQRGLVSSTTTVFCRRNLRIGNQLYPCTHPQNREDRLYRPGGASLLL